MFIRIFGFFGLILKKFFKFLLWLVFGFFTPWGCMIRLALIGLIVGICVWAL